MRNPLHSNTSAYSKNVSVIISMTLVLFVFGVLLFLLINVQRITNYIKESFTISMYIDNQASSVQIQAMKTLLASKKFTKQIVFISRDSAAREFAKQIGEDFLSTIGENPLSHSINLQVKSDYVSLVNMSQIKEELLREPIVEDVIYDDALLEKLFSNSRKIGLWLIFLCVLFLVISIVLINNSIRLTIFARRFLIRTQQMVGATQNFIQRPFLVNGFWQGFFLYSLFNASARYIFFSIRA